MLENLLCNSALISKRVAAAVDIIGGIGAPMRSQCKPAGGRRVPFRMIHGESDQVLRFDQATDVDGAPFLSTSERPGGGLGPRRLRGLDGGRWRPRPAGRARARGDAFSL